MRYLCPPVQSSLVRPEKAENAPDTAIKAASFCGLSGVTRVLGASLLTLTVGAGAILSSETQADEPYIQGALGYGLVDSFEQSQGGTMTTISNDSMPPAMGFEAGLDGLGNMGKIRAGVSYQSFDAGFSDPDGDGTVSDSEIELLGANMYYHMGETMAAGGMLQPYVGAGLVWVTPENFDTEMTYALHAGADMPYTDTVSLGAKYSYLIGTDFSSGDDLSVSSENMHLFSATMTYKFKGGIQQQAMQPRANIQSNQGMRPQSTMRNMGGMNRNNMNMRGSTYGRTGYRAN